MTAQAQIIGYNVTNRITGVVKFYKSSKAATTAMNKADNAYGAYITSRRAVWSDEV